jgi:sugar/nucleoside kinase (ribokinase family)
MKPNLTSDVIVAGELYVDLILSGFDFWPQPGKEAIASEFYREIGGGTAITACGLAKLGLRTSILGVLGEDSGAWMIEQLSRRAVDTRDIQFNATEPTGFTVAATSPEDRAFLTYPGANRGLREALMQAAAEKHFAHTRHVHLACAPDLDSAADLFQQIHDSGSTISLDVGWHEKWLSDPRAVELLPLIDVFLPNEVEARQMTGKQDPAACLRWCQEAGARLVALKLGSLGSAVLSAGDVIVVQAPNVTAIDTTGAGDCFDAGFLNAWLNGESPEACLQAANVCGALSTEAFGGIGGFPTPERLKQELKIHSCAK